MNTSYWESDVWQQAASGNGGGFVHSDVDVAVIGGGIIGISTAIELAQHRPDLRIVVIERSDPPRGASTRNAGFACFGSLSEIAYDIDLMGADAARALVQRRLDGLHTLRTRCGDEHIGYEEHGGTEIFTDDHPSLKRIDEINTLLAPLFEKPAFERCDDRIRTDGFGPSVTALVRTPYEGTLHSGLLVRRLWHLAQTLGVEIIVGEVVPSTQLVLQSGERISARRVVLATNALFSESLASSRFAACRPGRGQVLVTQPIAGLALRGSYHFDEGYVYFRNVGNRILLGGGRNLAFEEETTTEFATTPLIQNYLDDLLHRVIAPSHQVEIDLRWAGIMGFRDNKQPFVGEIAPGIIQAFGCNGMGVAIGSTIAAEAAMVTLHHV